MIFTVKVRVPASIFLNLLHKTAFQCEFGTYEYTVVPMGLLTARSFYQSWLEAILRKHGPAPGRVILQVPDLYGNIISSALDVIIEPDDATDACARKV